MNPLQQFFLQITNNRALILPIMVWTMVWKGLALWRAAKNEQKSWFLILLLVNFLGLPEIAYLLFFQRDDKWIWKIREALHR